GSLQVMWNEVLERVLVPLDRACFKQCVAGPGEGCSRIPGCWGRCGKAPRYSSKPSKNGCPEALTGFLTLGSLGFFCFGSAGVFAALAADSSSTIRCSNLLIVCFASSNSLVDLSEIAMLRSESVINFAEVLGSSAEERRLRRFSSETPRFS